MEKELEAAYQLEVSKMTSVRDIYYLKTKDRRFLCVKGYDIPEAEMRFIARVLEHLTEAGYRCSPRMVPTRTRARWITYDNKYYMLTNWIQGKSPDFTDRQAFRQAIRTLAEFHRYATGMPLQEAPARRTRYAMLPASIASYRSTLSRYRMAGDMKPFTALCETAVHLIKHPASEKALDHERNVGAFAHGDYNYPNLVVDGKGVFHLIDFENTSLHARMTDLAHLLHRNATWDGPQTVRWIEEYDRIRPLTSEERHLLFALLHVPYPLVRAIRMKKSARAVKRLMPERRTVEHYVRTLRTTL
ncbi:phosphotransferase [Brevibacillus sp. SYP-B805]|nr:phosphotransferase [Brevibacillus sp. SYP-B805]